MGADLVVYGVKGSRFVRKPQVLLAEQGDAFSIADIAVATPFVSLRFAGGRIDAARWPKLAAYVEKTHARPSIAACIEEESRIFLPRDYELCATDEERV